MSKYIPGNQKHLTLNDRIYIENELAKGTSFKDILSVTVCDSRDGYFDTARCQKYRHNRHVLSHIFCIVFPEP